MKNLFFATVLIFTSSIIFAQSPISKGESQINIGLGLSSWGIPIYGGFDYCIYKDITVGGEASFRSYSEFGYNSTVLGISGNGNYHFNSILEIPTKYDFYAGLNVGLYIWNLPSNYPGSHTSGLGAGMQVGGRYYFTNRISANLEFGGGAVSNGKIGISFKL